MSVPIAPVFVDRSSSFVVQHDDVFLRVIQRVIDDKPIRFRFLPDKYKFIACTNQFKVVIRLFSAEHGRILECRRKSGCVLEFGRWLAGLCDAVGLGLTMTESDFVMHELK
jgi:hypothetical protein